MRKLLIFITLLSCYVSASAQTTREWRDSVTYLSQLIEQNPKSLELRMRKAEANIALEQWQYALDEYSNILELYPTHLGALYFRAYVNDKLKRYSFARQDYEQVLRYAPDHEGALTGLILVNLSDNRLLDAFDEANHLVELYPDRSSSYALRAQVEETRKMIYLAIDDISQDMLGRMLDTGEYPDPDLMIRTCGEQRISNFLLYELAYSELIFVDKYWPDFSEKDFDNCLEENNNRTRRFGDAK